MRKFLTLKHWQLFTLLIGIPMILQFIFFGAMMASNNSRIMIGFVPVILILFLGVFFGWFYALGINLHKKLPPTVSMNLNRFKVFLLIPVVYMLLIIAFMTGMFFNLSNGSEINGTTFALMFLLHLFCMFCVFYCLYFNAKALKAVELQRQVTFNDFVGEFFLIWFFPVGVWIIQPRINKLFSANNRHYTDPLS